MSQEIVQRLNSVINQEIVHEMNQEAKDIGDKTIDKHSTIKNWLLDFLQIILKNNESNRITDIQIILGEEVNKRVRTLSLQGEMDNGSYCEIEIELEDQNVSEDINYFYWGLLQGSQMGSEMKPFYPINRIVICLLNEQYVPYFPSPKGKKISHKTIHLSKGQEMHFILLPERFMKLVSRELITL